jgi:hypothetical protein
MSQQALECGLYVIYRNFWLVENLVTLGGVSHVDFCQHLAPAVAHTCLHKDTIKTSISICRHQLHKYNAAEGVNSESDDDDVE